MQTEMIPTQATRPTPSEAPLHSEEAFLWQLATTWREPAPPDGPLDWSRLVAMAQANRMQTLLHRALAETKQLDALPDAARAALLADVAKLRNNASQMGVYLARYLRLAAQRGVETVVLKGLAVSLNVYGDAAMRPGGDIDILVRRDAVEESLAILLEMGVGPFWPNLMHDDYYDRHHLHQQRCTPDLQIWFEVHWALDHPLTLLTVDYEAIMDRATPGTLLGEPVRRLNPVDLILTLSLHLVKHAVYLPSTLARPDLQRLILADGMLMYFLDVAEAIEQQADEIDWALLVEVAQRGGAVEVVGSVLHVCARHLSTPVPAWVLDALRVQGPGTLTRWAMQKVADYEISTHLGEESSRLWEFLLVTNGAFILRPIRLLDLATYCFPDGDFLRRRYGAASARAAGGHLLRAVGQYARVGVDTLYFTFERYVRMKSLGLNASFFNRLDSEG